MGEMVSGCRGFLLQYHEWPLVEIGSKADSLNPCLTISALEQLKREKKVQNSVTLVNLDLRLWFALSTKTQLNIYCPYWDR